MEWISKFQRRSAIKKYALKLGPMLRQRYGASETYSAGQVKLTVEFTGLPSKYIHYGYAIYLSMEDFDTIQPELDQPCNYLATRQEIADVCFSGDAGFSVRRAISYGASGGNVGWDVGPSEGGSGGSSGSD